MQPGLQLLYLLGFFLQLISWKLFGLQESVRPPVRPSSSLPGLTESVGERRAMVSSLILLLVIRFLLFLWANSTPLSAFGLTRSLSRME